MPEYRLVEFKSNKALARFELSGMLHLIEVPFIPSKTRGHSSAHAAPQVTTGTLVWYTVMTFRLNFSGGTCFKVFVQGNRSEVYKLSISIVEQ